MSDTLSYMKHKTILTYDYREEAWWGGSRSKELQFPIEWQVASILKTSPFRYPPSCRAVPTWPDRSLNNLFCGVGADKQMKVLIISLRVYLARLLPESSSVWQRRVKLRFLKTSPKLRTGSSATIGKLLQLI